MRRIASVASVASIFIVSLTMTGVPRAEAKDAFCGPMAKPQRMFLVTVLALFCALAPQAWRFLPGISLPAALLILIIAGSCWTALRRLVRVARALHTKKP